MLERGAATAGANGGICEANYPRSRAGRKDEICAE